MASDTRPTFDKAGKQRVKVALKPGFHLTDWMALVRGGRSDLSGLKGGPQRKITRAELAEHTSQYDSWTAFNGKVYNISQYLHYHPGGSDIVLEHAGKDCTAEYNKYHKWININSMLGKCVIGTLVDDAITAFGEYDL
jgi:cytochrome b involved in lipid metabolism